MRSDNCIERLHQIHMSRSGAGSQISTTYPPESNLLVRIANLYILQSICLMPRNRKVLTTYKFPSIFLTAFFLKTFSAPKGRLELQGSCSNVWKGEAQRCVETCCFGGAVDPAKLEQLILQHLDSLISPFFRWHAVQVSLQQTPSWFAWVLQALCELLVPWAQTQTVEDVGKSNQ